MTLLKENDWDELDQLAIQPEIFNDPTLILTFFSKKDIDLTQIYREEIIKLKIFRRKREEILKTGELKDEVFDDFLRESTGAVSEVKHFSDGADFLLNLGDLAINIIHNPNKRYLTKLERRTRLVKKIIVWIVTGLWFLVFDFLCYFIPYLLTKAGIIAQVPKWCSFGIPNFLINLIHKI